MCAKYKNGLGQDSRQSMLAKNTNTNSNSNMSANE